MTIYDFELTPFLYLFSGLGQNESEFINTKRKIPLPASEQIDAILSESFSRAGFANRTYGENKFLPCSVGTFVNSSVTDPSELKCLGCPAGKPPFNHLLL